MLYRVRWLIEWQRKAKKCIKEESRYTIIAGKLYRKGLYTPLLRCLALAQAQAVVIKVHEGICGSQIGGQSLGNKIVRARYYWPTLRSNRMELLKKCDACQGRTNLYELLTEHLHSFSSLLPLNKKGIDILSPLRIGIHQLEYLIVAIDYFSKWFDAEPMAIITSKRVKKFLWRSILCRYGVLNALIVNNST